jgi:hypothetical protein
MSLETSSVGGFRASVNGQPFRFTDPTPDARQILHQSEFVPADECVLVQELAHGTRAIGLDETVNLSEPGTETFWAFRSDRIYRFTVDGRGFDWGESTIREADLRRIARVAEDQSIILERENEPDQVLNDHNTANLASRGTEHFLLKRFVEVFFKNKPYRIPGGTYTTEKLIEFFPIEQGYLLNLKTEDGELVTLKPGQEVHVKNGMHFYSQPPGGGSS